MVRLIYIIILLSIMTGTRPTFAERSGVSTRASTHVKCSTPSNTSSTGSDTSSLTLPDGFQSSYHPVSEEEMPVTLPASEMPLYNAFKRALSSTNDPVEKKRMRPIKGSKTDDVFQYLLANRITNRSDFEACNPEEIRRFLCLSNIESILPRGFNFVAMQLRMEPFAPYTDAEVSGLAMANAVRVNGIRRFLCGVHEWSLKQYAFFLSELANCLNGKSKKKNCIWVFGPSNTGKSTLMASFIDLFFPTCVGRPDNSERTSFPFNSCVNKRVIFWEEPAITPRNVEDVKCLMSGTKFSTDIKYQSAIEIAKTPVVVTANKVPWAGMTDSNIMKSRCFSFKLSTVLSEAWLTANAHKYFPFSKQDWQMAYLEVCSPDFVKDAEDMKLSPNLPHGIDVDYSEFLSDVPFITRESEFLEESHK